MKQWDKVADGVVRWFVLIIIWAGLGLLMAFPLMWTWNFVMPYLFGLKTISWGMAWCLNFLAFVLWRSVLIEQEKK